MMNPIEIIRTKISANSKMNSSERKKVHAIIHGASASAAAIGGGLANIPGSDAPALVALQTGMIISIGAVFKVPFSESVAKSIIADFLGVSVGKVVANILTGWLPGIGNGINAATAATLTEIIGWTVTNDILNDTTTIDPETGEILRGRMEELKTSVSKRKKENNTLSYSKKTKKENDSHRKKNKRK